MSSKLGAIHTQFAEQADLTLIFPFDEVREKTANRLVGGYSVEEAVEILLAGTGLKPKFSNRVVLHIATDNQSEPRGEEMNINKKTGLGVFLAAVFSVGAGAQSPPEEGAEELDSNVLEEIIVRARRRNESLQDVPISITSFSEQDILLNRIRDLNDYFMRTPNVSFRDEGTRSNRDIGIRGVSNIGGRIWPVAIYVDEINVVNGAQSNFCCFSSYNQPLDDVQSIEVLRGPQGTYFGRNATGGAINITLNKPGPEYYGQLNAELGKHNTWGLGGILNIPVNESFFLRGSVFYEESDGMIKNINPVGGGSGYENLNLRLAARFLPNDNVTIDLTAQYTEEDTGATTLVATGILMGSSAFFLEAATGETEARDEVGGFYPENKTRINQDFRVFHRNEYLTLSARLEWDLGPVTVTSITGLFQAELDFKKDLDFISDNILYFTDDDESQSLSTELRVSSNGDGPIQWLVGGIYAEDELNQTFCLCNGAFGLFGVPLDFKIDEGNLDFNQDAWGIFGEVYWDINDQATLTVGGRYSNDEVTEITGGIDFGEPRTPMAGTDTFTDFSPKIALTYDWTEGFTTYATVSKGYKTGGLQFNVTDFLPITPFDEEELWNYEVGLKGVWAEGRVAANLAIFHMDWTDMQVGSSNAILNPDTGLVEFFGFITNAASATSTGVEVDVRAIVAEGFQVGAAVGYLNAEFDDFTNANIDGETVDLTGYALPKAPEWTASADAHYNFKVGGQWEPFVRAEWAYRGQTTTDIRNVFLTDFPFHPAGYAVTNLRLGAVIQNYRIEAYINNLFDEDYYTSPLCFGFAGCMVTPAEQYWGVRFRMQTK